MDVKQSVKRVRCQFRDKLINIRQRAALQNNNFTIISSDCTGGMICHELGVRFNSPTVNMFMSAPDFLKFVRDMRRYLDIPMKEMTLDFPYPCAKLGDIVLHLVHYESVALAQEKWDERKMRIQWNNIFYIMNDRNGCNYELAKQFDELPYQHKVFFASERTWLVGADRIKCACYIRPHGNEKTAPIMTSFRGMFSLHRNYDCFNYVDWLNGDGDI